jgi:hypothetical protein
MPQIKKVPVSALMEIVCAWKGCNRAVFIGDTLPAGWKCLVVAPGPLFRKKNLLSADVDGVLCTEHFTELLNLLKVGQSTRTK